MPSSCFSPKSLFTAPEGWEVTPEDRPVAPMEDEDSAIMEALVEGVVMIDGCMMAGPAAASFNTGSGRERERERE